MAMRFDVIEICGGSGRVSAACAARGLVVGPVVDRSRSPHFDILDRHTREWLFWLIQEGRVLFVCLEPPSTTFSPAAYPSVRYYDEPLGVRQA